MRQLQYSEYKGANKLLFFDLDMEVPIETIRNIVVQIAPSAIAEYLGYNESLDRYLYVLIVAIDDYVCENRLAAYEESH